MTLEALAALAALADLAAPSEGLDGSEGDEPSPAASRQVRVLRQFGHPHPETASFEEASAFLAEQLGSAA